MRHLPAFVGQIKDLFHLQPGDLFLDLTLGDGGHSQEALDAGARVVSFDVDEQAISRATNFLSGKYTPIIVRPEMAIALPADFTWLIVHSNFAKVGEVAVKLKLPSFKAILADLGTSQYHLAEAQRGFSFNLEGPLDMRLDQRLGLSAADLVNALSERELTELLLLADEYQAKTIARAIARARKNAPITTTSELAEIVSQAKRPTAKKIHPATKTFMALRMAVNLEREALGDMLAATPNLLAQDGILGVISFHSGEDRLVKRFIKEKKKTGILRVINVKPIKPNEKELQINPKVRSAKLRLAQKI
ncbi:MAG: 16S rRNA (cytosine(1402)-N(4))-methyltransferase RsmH [Microgenomates group bacterium]